MRRGATLSLRECFAMELRLALRFMQRPDFYEGVRAAVIDQDGKPVWNPKTLEELDASADVAKFFEPLSAQESQGGELVLPK
jgi:enoyl-CoA hydratase